MMFRREYVTCVCLVILVFLGFLWQDIGSVLLPRKMKDPNISILPQTCEGAQCRPQFHTKVILLTYMRSGSSFTGDILSAHPDVFYVFEPLHRVKRISRKSFTFLDNRTIHLKQEDKDPLLKQVISGFLNCSFDELDIETLTGRMIMKQSKGTSVYVKCLKGKSGIWAINNCLPLLYRACLQKKIVVTKTIRFPMTLAEQLMQEDPDVKVIHLIRDPRATIRSQIRLLPKTVHFETRVETVCNRILPDLKTFEKMKAMYPGRVKQILYENLADHPIEVSESLYKFLNVSFSSRISDYVRNITMSGVKKECGVICAYKANSSLHSQKWRKQLKFKKAQFIDTMCSEVYSYLGYRQVTTKDEYLNISIPLH